MTPGDLNERLTFSHIPKLSRVMLTSAHVGLNKAIYLLNQPTQFNKLDSSNIKLFTYRLNLVS